MHELSEPTQGSQTDGRERCSKKKEEKECRSREGEEMEEREEREDGGVKAQASALSLHKHCTRAVCIEFFVLFSFCFQS